MQAGLGFRCSQKGGFGITSFREAATLLGVSVEALRNWESEGKIMPSHRTPGGHRMYDLAELLGVNDKTYPTIAYARVSSSDQKEDLERQHAILEAFCNKNGWQTEIIKDLGSGMNANKKGLQRLLELIVRGQMSRLVLTHKDRLLRFGADLIFRLCEIKGIEIVIINKGEQPSFEEELTRDVMELMTVFSAKLYGQHSQKSKKMAEQIEQIVSEEKPQMELDFGIPTDNRRTSESTDRVESKQ